MYPELVERNRLGHDVIWHAILLGDGAEPGLDSEQLVRVLVDLMLKLGTPQEEHAAKLAEGDPVQQPSDPGKREPEFIQRNAPANLSQQGCRVAAVPRVWIDRRRPQQSDLVVVPERANRHPTEPRELADAEHGTSMHPSPCERVKTIPRMNPNPHRDLDADPARPRLPCRAPGRIHTPAPIGIQAMVERAGGQAEYSCIANTGCDRSLLPRRGTSGTGWTDDRLRGGHVPASPSTGHPHGDRADSDARIVAMLLIADRGRRLDATRAQSRRSARHLEPWRPSAEGRRTR